MNRSLKEYTTRDLVVAHWMEKMDRAFHMMMNAHVRHLPVVDEGGAIIGIISDRDFQRALQVDQPDFVSGLPPQAEFDPNARVRDYMSWPVEAISEGRSIADAAKLMIDRKISSLIITRGQAVVGIVTTEDLLRALVGEREGLLKEMKTGLQSAIYNSPIGQIAQTLANVGV